MRDEGEVTLRHTVDALKDKYTSLDQSFVPGKEEHRSWYSTVQRRLSRANTTSGELGDDHVASGDSRWRDLVDLVGKKGLAAIATALVVLLLVSCTSTAMLLRSWSTAGQAATAPAASQYLQNITMSYEAGQPGGSGPAITDLDTAMHSCAKRIQLPLVQLPKQLPVIPSWQSNGSYPDTPLDELALNCSNPAEAASCQQAASASNAYEGGGIDLDPEELQGIESFLQAPSHPDAGQQASQDSEDDLSELNLDCNANPQACAAVSEDTNSYTSEAADSAAIAEAAAYLQSVHGPSAWSTVIGGDQSDADAQNNYEGGEQSWVQKRLAEEAVPESVDSSEWGLDCNHAAGETDEATEAECERTMTVNRYETTDSAQDSSLVAAQMALNMQQFHRTTGYDAVAVDWDDFGTRPQQTQETDSEAAINRLRQLQQQMDSGRISGYDAPAVDDFTAAAPAPATVGHATVDSASTVNLDELLAARRYFKNPCNCGDAREDFKNDMNRPGRRVYYKNPANAPMFFSEDMPGAHEEQKPGTHSSPLWTALAALATIGASAAGTWYMFGQSLRSQPRPLAAEAESDSEASAEAEDQAYMDSTMSCELPPLQTMAARSPTAVMPVISEPEEYEAYENMPTSTGSGPGSRLIEGMASGMLRMRDSATDDAPINLHTRPSMLVDVQEDAADSQIERTPATGRTPGQTPGAGPSKK